MMLKHGSHGDEVKLLQVYLGALPDGSFGDITDKMVRSFQQKHHLKVDGVVGDVTWKTLRAAIPTVTIERTYSNNQGTKGIVSINGKKFCDSFELQDENNNSLFSCIPKGIYHCTRNWSPTFKKFLYILLHVPNRSGVRLHGGNYAGDTRIGLKSDTLGCVMFGHGYVTDDDGQEMMLNSTIAMNEFYDELRYKDFLLNII